MIGLKQTEVVVLKLSCVNCGAPLEIGPDLDTFACGYCGTQQRVERKGGTVALKRVEAAIKAVQRGTDRTAAELALTRLAKEIPEAESQRKVAIAMAQKKAESARSGRLFASLGAAAISSLALIMVLVPVIGDKMPKDSAWGPVFAFVILGVPIVVGIFVYRRIKKPQSEVKKVTDLWDAHIVKLKGQLAANRALLDEHPTTA